MEAMAIFSRFRLDGKRALITGASSGFGAHFAQLLSAAGAEVVLAARRVDKLAGLQKALQAQGREASSVSMDVGSRESVLAGFDQIGTCDIVVNNAGITVTRALLDQTEEDWDSVIDTNLKGCWLVATEALRPNYPVGVSSTPTTGEIFALMSWRDKRLMALSQAGLVEKFVDALVWIFYPIFLYQQGLSLPTIGWVISIYGFTWGVFQLLTGRLSDRIGRHVLNVSGMWICGAGVAAMVLVDDIVWWAASSAVSGFGMAMLYPNLSAAVADISPPTWRGSAIGIYRFWRDLGYGVGALGLGLTAYFTGQIQAAFWFVALAMFTSGALLWWLGEETHPLLSLSRPEKPRE